MKKIVFFLIPVLFILSCNSSKKYFQQGNYDAAVHRAVAKLRKKPTKEKEISILRQAYPLANKNDMDKINYLKLENNPDNWDEILKHYSRLKTRQAAVGSIISLIPPGSVEYREINYDAEIVQAKMKAAEYYYNHGKSLMENDQRMSYREAYESFVKAKEYNANYPDIDELIKESKEKGTTHVMVSVKNNTQFKLSKAFEEDVISFGNKDLNDKWIEYYIKADADDFYYDYNVYVTLKQIYVSPEKQNTSTYTEKKKVRDGWKYEYDSDGNVKKDTLGNDIKEPKYKTITCDVSKTTQEKSVRIETILEYFDNESQQVVETVPVVVRHAFDHVFGTANGDRKALSSESKDLLRHSPMAFPSDMDMIEDAKKPLRSAIEHALYSHRRILK